MEDNEEEKKEIEVVTGDDSELDISDVREHLNLDKVRETPNKQNIIIPEVKKDDETYFELLIDENNPSKAYFNCHTDITIPYDELECIVTSLETTGITPSSDLPKVESSLELCTTGLSRTDCQTGAETNNSELTIIQPILVCTQVEVS